jgi:hypothetical protein
MPMYRGARSVKHRVQRLLCDILCQINVKNADDSRVDPAEHDVIQNSNRRVRKYTMERSLTLSFILHNQFEIIDSSDVGHWL